MTRYPRALTPSSSGRGRLLTAFAALIVSALALAGCTAAPSGGSPATAGAADPQQLLAAYDLDGLDVRQVIDTLEAMPVSERPADLLASVQPDALVLRDADGREAALPMPDDEVYISVAPFREQTHECHFHSLTTCLGELDDREIRVTLTTADGDVLVDETRRTSDNGFTGFWVPRGIEATLTVGYAGVSGSATLSTIADDDPTCITTLQLL